jgi:hypothetical protein
MGGVGVIVFGLAVVETEEGSVVAEDEAAEVESEERKSRS